MNRMQKMITGLAAAASVAALAAFSANAGPGHAHDHAKVGAPAPNFTLTDTEGNSHTLSDLTKQGKVVVLEWFNPQCPFVVKHHEKHSTMKDLASEFADKGVVWMAINSGAPGKQGAGLELNQEYKSKWTISYPILMDESGEVGHLYGAQTTPHMYVIDTSGELRYMGAIDNDRSATNLGDVNYVRQALNQVLAGETVTTPETRAYGCSVKYAN